MGIGDKVLILDLPESILGGKTGVIVEETSNGFYDWWVRLDSWISPLAFREAELEVL